MTYRKIKKHIWENKKHHWFHFTTFRFLWYITLWNFVDTQYQNLCNQLNINLSNNNSCFSCNIAITNVLVSHTCKIRFQKTSKVKALYKCIPTQKFQNVANLHDQMSMFWNLVFYFDSLDSVM